MTVRLYKYYSLKQLNLRKTTIHNALLKYGYGNFSLEILEYCTKGVNPVIREQYYLELLKPEYNILDKAGSLLGFKHTTETLEFFKNERKVSDSTRKNLSKAATGRIMSSGQRTYVSLPQNFVKNYLKKEKVLNFQVLHVQKYLRPL